MIHDVLNLHYFILFFSPKIPKSLQGNPPSSKSRTHSLLELVEVRGRDLTSWKGEKNNQRKMGQQARSFWNCRAFHHVDFCLQSAKSGY